MYDWEKPLNVVMKKVFNYDSLHSNDDDICTAVCNRYCRFMLR